MPLSIAGEQWATQHRLPSQFYSSVGQMSTWKKEIIGKQTFLNTQDTVFEVLSKTPEDILCRQKNAVDIDMMIKRAQNAQPDEQYGVRLMPYRDVKTDRVIDPLTQKHRRNVSLAIACIAADRDDWTRFIPVGLKARVMSIQQKRAKEVVQKQNAPYTGQPHGKMAENSDSEADEEFILCSTNLSDDSSESQSDADHEFYDTDEDVEDKADDVTEYDPATGRFRRPKAEPTVKNFGIKAYNASTKATEELFQRVATMRRENEQKEAKTLPSDRVRRQAASLNDPECEQNLSELSQRYHAVNNDDNRFNLDWQREAAKKRELGLPVGAPVNSFKTTSAGKPDSDEVLDRFTSVAAAAADANEKKFKKNQQKQPPTLEQLMAIGRKMPLPPSLEKANKTSQSDAVSSKAKSVASATSQSGSAVQMHRQLRLIRKKQLEMMQEIATLEEMICLGQDGK